MFNTKQRAAAGQQYAIIVGLVGVAALLSVTVLGSNIRQLFSSASNVLGGASNGVPPAVTSPTSPPPPPPPPPGPFVSCQEQLSRVPGSPSGLYTIVVNGQNREVWCDMTSHGGGWIILRDSVTAGMSGAAFGTVSATPGWSLGYNPGTPFGDLPVTDFFVEVDAGPVGIFRQTTLLDVTTRPTAAQLMAPNNPSQWECSNTVRTNCLFTTHLPSVRDWGVWRNASGCCLGTGGMWFHSRTDNVVNYNYGICEGGYPNGTLSSAATNVTGCTAGQYTSTASGTKRFRIGIKYADGSGSATPPVSQAPVWQTNAALGSFPINTALSGVTMVATDPDSDPISYSVVSSALPSGVSVSGNSLTGTPTNAGNFSVTMRADDGRGKTADRTFTFSVGTATSCAALLAANASLASGLYTINPGVAGSSNITVYCDMTTSGGGWTILADNTVGNLHAGAQGTVSTGTGWQLNYNGGFISNIPATALMLDMPGVHSLVLDDIVSYGTTTRPLVSSLVGGASSITWQCITNTGANCQITARGASSTGGANRNWGYWHYTSGCCGSGPGIWYYSQNSSTSNVLNYGSCNWLYPKGVLTTTSGSGGCAAGEHVSISPTGNLRFRIGIRH